MIRLNYCRVNSKEHNAGSRLHSRSRRAAAQGILALAKGRARARPMSAACASGIPCGLRLAKFPCAVAERNLIYQMDH